MVSKVAIVTGASQGIGACIAKKLAALGHQVVLIARGVEKLGDVQNEIDQAGGVSLALAADVSDIEQVKGVVTKTMEIYGRVDYLVNNAAYVAPLHQFAQGDIEEWQKMMSVNVWGALYMTRTVVPSMISRGSGHILFMSSRAGVQPTAGLAVHSGTKHLIEGVAGAIRQELSGTGVKVSVVRPGGVDTPGYHHAVGGDGPQPDWVPSSTNGCLTADSVAKVVVNILEQEHGTITDVSIHK